MEFSWIGQLRDRGGQPPPSPSGKSWAVWRQPHCRGLISLSLRECGRRTFKKKKKDFYPEGLSFHLSQLCLGRRS